MRILSCAALSFSGAVFACHYIVPGTMFHGAICLLLIASIFGALFLRNKLRIYVLLFCVFVSLGIFRYGYHADRYLGLEKLLPADQYRITAYLAEYPVVEENYTKLTVHLRSDQLPEVKTVLYDYHQIITQPERLKPGDELRTSVRFVSSAVISGEETDTFISKGIYLRGYLTDDILQYETWWGKLLYYPLTLAHEMQGILDSTLSNRTAVFMKALLTGDKTSLYDHPNINHSLTRAGLSHVVAVSGMHVSFLVGIVMMLFGSRRGSLLSVVFIALFSVMTGMSPSVLRAAFMQTLYLLAPIFRSEADGITSISFALFILLAINPFAVSSVSLQLSFSAMSGIILVTPRMFEWFRIKGEAQKGILRKLHFFVASSVSASLGTTLFTAPLCALHFGSFALFAPVSNLLVLWIVPVCFQIGLLICILYSFVPGVTQILADVLSCIVEGIYGIAELIAQIPFSTIYLPMELMLFWLICVGLVIGVSYLIKGQNIYRPMFSVVFTFGLLFLLFIGAKLYYEDGSTVAAIDVGQGQSIAILNEDRTVLIDCGGAYDAGQTVVEWLYSHGRQNVDLLIITHFDEDHTNGMIDLMTQMPVNEIRYCGLNITEYESKILKEISEYTSLNQTKMTLSNRSGRIKVGKIHLSLFVPEKPQNNNGLIVLADVPAYKVLVTGDADTQTESEMLGKMNISDGDCIVVGHHGSKYSTSELLLDRFKPEVALISCGYNHYGHPSEDVLRRLRERNVVVYRTDELGNVEIKVR